MTTAEQYSTVAAVPDSLASVARLPGWHPSEALHQTPTSLQQAALADLPRYDVTVVRRSSHCAPIRTADYTIHQETVRYSDGAVRLVTLGLPKQPRSNVPVVSGDPWFTGPSGFNRLEIEQIVTSGFPVIWNHHQGRHALLPTSKDRLTTTMHSLANKSLAKSAAQDHALLRHLQANTDIFPGRVIRRGYSRGAMSGEAFIALAGPGCEVVWSDLEAACFARRVGTVASSKLIAKQLPHELAAIGEIVRGRLAHKDVKAGARQLGELLATTDLHPQNLAHELAWFRLLVNGDAGRYAQALPLDSKGVRTVYEHDYSGQQADWRRIHAARLGIVILEVAGAHLSGATKRMTDLKGQRLTRLADYSAEHASDFSQLTTADVLPLTA